MTDIDSAEPEEFPVRNFVDPDELAADIDLNGVEINSAFIDQTSLCVLYGSKAALASRQSSMLKITRDAVIAKVAQQLRDEAVANKEKLTEKALEERVTLNKKVLRARHRYTIAVQVEEEAKAALEAIRHRRDMLIQLGAQAREESKGGLVLKSQTSTSVRGESLKEKLRQTQQAVRQ